MPEPEPATLPTRRGARTVLASGLATLGANLYLVVG